MKQTVFWLALMERCYEIPDAEIRYAIPETKRNVAAVNAKYNWAITVSPPISTLRGDKVSMLTHTYPHKPLRKIKVTICNHQADDPLYVWPNV